MLFRFSFFFFKQKTAYEIMPSLVGSEMCIRDSKRAVDMAYKLAEANEASGTLGPLIHNPQLIEDLNTKGVPCRESPVSYTHLTLPTIYSV